MDQCAGEQFFFLTRAEPGSKPPPAGSGSRAGWWLCAVHGMALTMYGGDVERAVWEGDLNAWLALQPAALEAAGQLPESEHYAIREGLRAADAVRAKLREEAAKDG